jgi:hypothetical protein
MGEERTPRFGKPKMSPLQTISSVTPVKKNIVLNDDLVKPPAARFDENETNQIRDVEVEVGSSVDVVLLLLYAEILRAREVLVVKLLDAGRDGWLGGYAPLGDGDLVALLGLLEQRAA